jgi:hypothetical protein
VKSCEWSQREKVGTVTPPGPLGYDSGRYGPQAQMLRVTRIGWTIAVLLAVMLATSGCPAPRQRDKDQQTGMGPGGDAVMLTFDGQRLCPGVPAGPGRRSSAMRSSASG